MPKGAPGASRVHAGGRASDARRRSVSRTPTGRVPNAPRLTAPAALVITAQLHLWSSADECCLVVAIERAIGSPGGHAGFMRGSAVRAAPAAVRALIESYTADKRNKVGAQPHRLRAIAIEVRERLRVHAGPPHRVVSASPESPPPLPALPGSWLGTGGATTARAPPPDGGRILGGTESWGVDRLGTLPDHTVICYERAAGRVQEWRSRTNASPTAAPPPSLLRAIMHTSAVPTALASHSDHFYLPVLGRWVTPAEILTMFSVPGDHPLRAVLCSPPVSPVAAVSMLGRAVHVRAAARALSLALAAIPLQPSPSNPLRYASACSGIDLAAVALDTLLPAAWTYVFASETNEHVAAVLARAHAARGLRPDAIHPDATLPAATTDAPPVHLWLVTPPCEAYSRRNHHRSEGREVDAVSDFDAMLEYARAHRPMAIVVENVEEPAAVLAITAAVLSLPGYTWVTVESEAAAYGPMARARCYWVGNVSGRAV